MFDRDRTLREIESRRLVLPLHLLCLWEMIARLSGFCLGAVFDPNVTCDDRGRELVYRLTLTQMAGQFAS